VWELRAGRGGPPAGLCAVRPVLPSLLRWHQGKAGSHPGRATHGPLASPLQAGLVLTVGSVTPADHQGGVEQRLALSGVQRVRGVRPGDGPRPPVAL
jgi:hypothetical protein